MLKRSIEKLRGLGFVPFSAFEYEFFAFSETPHSLREKGYRNLTPITPGNFGYSVLRNSVWADFYKQLLDTMGAMDIPIEGIHTETGPGVLEAAINVDTSLESADRAALFKTFSKVVAQKNDLILNFMSKWSEKYPGQGGHIHVSLKTASGASAFHDPTAEWGRSKTMRHFVGGLQAQMPHVLAMVASTINAYSRLVPGAWAPTNATWGVENRTTALRVIPGSAKSQRVEYRVAAADSNPYLALAAALASGAWGIENEIEPTEPIRGNAYAQAHDPARDLPATLWEAAQRLRKSEVAREVFGDAFVEHYAATREWEEREFRKSITDWELARYFEII
jgi:glutamine synthetase